MTNSLSNVAINVSTKYNLSSNIDFTTQHAILLTGLAATIGWLYSARRNRSLSRKQHTINVILQSNMNDSYIDSKNKITPTIRSGKCSDDIVNGSENEITPHLRRILNHHEFVAAGVRNGDFDEKLLKDSSRSSYVKLFESCENYIWSLRNDRERQSLYEHLEWLQKQLDHKEARLFQVHLRGNY